MPQIYGRKAPAKEIALSGTGAIPMPAQQLISTLNAKTPKRRNGEKLATYLPPQRVRNLSSLKDRIQHER